MAIEFNCTGCGRRLSVGDDAEGRQAKCPQCGTVMTVPAIVKAEPSPASGESPFAPGSSPFTAPSAAAFRDIPNYLVQAILCTLFCCLPFGIVSIVYAAQVNGKVAAGDYLGAQTASNNARTWCWVSFWCGLVPVLLYLLSMLSFLALGWRH
jgi:DNA-directed RNA polymerase subunit RPC12/RpoP